MHVPGLRDGRDPRRLPADRVGSRTMLIVAAGGCAVALGWWPARRLPRAVRGAGLAGTFGRHLSPQRPFVAVSGSGLGRARAGHRHPRRGRQLRRGAGARLGGAFRGPLGLALGICCRRRAGLRLQPAGDVAAALGAPSRARRPLAPSPGAWPPSGTPWPASGAAAPCAGCCCPPSPAASSTAACSPSCRCTWRTAPAESWAPLT